jgi:folate-binding protein YgfZ
MKEGLPPQTKEELVLHAIHHAAIKQNTLQTIIEVRGNDAVDFFHRMSSNDLKSLRVEGSRMTSFLTDKGKLVDAVVIHLRPESLLVVPSEGRTEEFLRWIDRFVIMEDIRLFHHEGDVFSFSIMGPAAFTITAEGFGIQAKPGTHQEISVDGGTILVAPRQDFAINQVDCLVSKDAIASFRDRLNSFGDTLPSLDQECFDTLRAMTGIPAPGHEISPEFNPFEIGLLHTLNFNKGCYVGQEVIARLDTYKKVQRRLTGLTFHNELSGSGLELFANKGKIGQLTTVGLVSVAGQFHALAVVKRGEVTAGDHAWTTQMMTGNEGTLYDLPWTGSVNG